MCPIRRRLLRPRDFVNVNRSHHHPRAPLLGRIRTTLAKCLFREIAPQAKLPSLGIRGVLIVLAVIVVGIMLLRYAAIAGVYVDQWCVSRATFVATKSLAARVVPFLPHSREGGRLLAGGDFDQFHTMAADIAAERDGDGNWPGLWHASVTRPSDYIQDPNNPGNTTLPLGKFPQLFIGSVSTFKPPIEYHPLAALITLALCGAGVWRERWEQHRIRSVQIAFAVSLVLILVTLPAAFGGWSGPQLVRIFWEQVYSISGNGTVTARDRVWVQPALCETAGVLFFGIVYAVCLFVAAWPAAKYLVRGGRASSTSRRGIMRHDGVVCCGRCGHQLGDLSTCPECGLARDDLQPRGWPWNSRWFRTQRARRVALCSLVATAAIASAALPLIVGVAQVLFRRL